MNPEEIIKAIAEKTHLSEEQCGKIKGIIENAGNLGFDSKDKIIKEVAEKLNMSEDQANDIYQKAMEVISGNVGGGIMDKIKGIFGK